MGLFDNFRKKKQDDKSNLSGFSKTKETFADKLKKIAGQYSVVNETVLEELLIVLLESDVALQTADKIINNLKMRAEEEKFPTFNELLEAFVEEVDRIYHQQATIGFRSNLDGANVILMVGVNGAGKTTSIAKLANLLKSQGKSVLLCAADTFRAGAVEQLLEWSERIGVECVVGKATADPASVVVDACRRAKELAVDYLLVDTAGRLQNKVNLMQELNKIKRVAEKEMGDVINSYLILDSTTGKNGLNQAEIFLENCEINGIILTKMDGTSRGGIVLTIRDQLNIDVKYVGIGETINDFAEFKLENFLLAMIEEFVDE
ncbi:MAG: signal recognition particle-docking protein FtsY [Erysipelotrichaceae bacterium]